jgi:hypothetical protein
MRDTPAVLLIIGFLCVLVLAVAVLCPSSPLSHGLCWLGSLVNIDIPDVDSSSGKPAGDPGEHVTVTGHGSAVWVPDPGTILPDSVPISVTVDIGPGLDTATVVIGTDTIPVALDIQIDGPILPFRAWGELAFDGPSLLYGGGLSWEPLRLWGASAGPGLCAGDGWFAPVARISRPIYSTINAGAEAGWRFQRGPDEPHVGVSLGFAL